MKDNKYPRAIMCGENMGRVLLSESNGISFFNCILGSTSISRTESKALNDSWLEDLREGKAREVGVDELDAFLEKLFKNLFMGLK